jgi:hypothetical protein
MNDEHLKEREQWLREEIRELRKMNLLLLQWGTTVLAAVELNLYYIRKDVANAVYGQAHHQMLLPLQRWCLGTLFLVLLGWIFSHYTRRTSARLKAYREQLISASKVYSGIVEHPPVGGAMRVHSYLYFAFAVFDLGLWCLFYAGEKLHVSFWVPW